MSTTTPEFPEPEGLRELRAVAQRIVAQQERQMAPIRLALERGALADIQRVTAQLDAAFAPARASIDSVINSTVQRQLRETMARHDALFAQVRATAPAVAVARVLAAEGHERGESETAQEEAVPQSLSVGKEAQYSREQLMAAVGLLLSVHGTIVNLRKGDLADSGTLALLVAAMLLLMAIDSGSDD